MRYRTGLLEFYDLFFLNFLRLRIVEGAILEKRVREEGRPFAHTRVKRQVLIEERALPLLCSLNEQSLERTRGFGGLDK